MIISSSNKHQDTIRIKNVTMPDSVRANSDSVSIINTSQLHDSVLKIQKSTAGKEKFYYADTTAICARNSVADITFYNSPYIFTTSGQVANTQFPFLFIEKTRQMKIDSRTSIEKYLKSGDELAVNPLHYDWIIGLILIISFLFSLIRTPSRGLWHGPIRFFQFRGINDPSSRDVDSMFQWQSTIHNLASFLITGLFAYCAASYYKIIPDGINGLVFWLISFGIISIAITLRHIICIITGNMSGEREVFREYIVTVYQSYRFSALILFVLVILMSYTTILSAKNCISAGTIAFGMMYVIRVLRLILIFITRNISIFYLILYLCALEILPVLILVTYFTGLI